MKDRKYLKSEDKCMDLKVEDLDKISGGSRYYIDEYGRHVVAVSIGDEESELEGPAKIVNGLLR